MVVTCACQNKSGLTLPLVKSQCVRREKGTLHIVICDGNRPASAATTASAAVAAKMTTLAQYNPYPPSVPQPWTLGRSCRRQDTNSFLGVSGEPMLVGPIL
jgi:hypothetical protein